ncbi:LysR substrate-binding domain-containing protein [Cupriavidus plantarum]|uniref:LysR substrate-binding domain-containing protein n=1 Tax=Cupriavidus plantarum TaxID=942865 RepID=UPI0016026E4E|nr:LysR substrate-binding domain-containing protein [Cupriavidus plantarum]
MKCPWAKRHRSGKTVLVERDLAEGRLVKPFAEVQGCELAYYLVYRKQSRQQPAVLAFKAWLLEEIGPLGWWLG